MQLHEEIKYLREQKGLTQTELADDYTTASYISIIENGKAVPSKKILRRIAERLGKPSYYFEAQGRQDDDCQELRTKIKQLIALANDKCFDEAKVIAEELRSDLSNTTDDDIRGRYFMAIAYYSWAADDLDAATSYYRQALEHFRSLQWHHRCIDALYGLANIHMRRGNLSQAAQYFRDAIAIDDDTRSGSPQTLYRLRIDYANCLLRLGKPKEAHRLLNLLSASTADYSERLHIMLNLGRACQQIGDWQKASEYAHEASRLALERDDLALRASAQEIAANILTDMTDYENAELALAEAELTYRRLGHRRDCSRVVIQRAWLATYAERMDYADALLVSLGTNLEPDVYAEACRVKAEKHLKLGENQWAIEHLDSAAKSFIEAERFGSAIDSWGQAAEIARENGNVALAANLLFRVLDTYHLSRKGLSSDEVSP